MKANACASVLKTIVRLFVVTWAVLPVWSADPPGAFKNVGVEEFERLGTTGNAVVLDVRTPAEFAAGHLAGATNVNFLARDFKKALGGLDTNKVYLVYCASGGRSSQACLDMSQQDFVKVYNLSGGFRAWNKAGRAVKK